MNTSLNLSAYTLSQLQSLRAHCMDYFKEKEIVAEIYKRQNEMGIYKYSRKFK